MTLYDKNFPKLCITMEHRDYGEVFITVHTLKRMVVNMLYSSSASSQTLALLEQKCIEYQFFAVMSKEIQFEYVYRFVILTISESRI